MTQARGFRRLAVAGLVCGAITSTWPSPSQATFPGKNGRLAFAASCGVLQVNERRGDCSHTGVTKLRVINPRTGKRLRFRAAGCPGRCDEGDPRFSPNGRRLAFSRSTPGQEARPFVSDAVGGASRQVTRRGDGPAWSPNGKAVAIGQAAGLRVFRPGGAFVRRVAAGSVFGPDWSSIGRIAFIRRRELYTVSGRGGPARRLTRCACVFGLSWSPDGRRLALDRLTKGPYGVGVFVIDADGSNLRQIARGATSPAWSPDGRKIAYSRNGRGIVGARVVIARADGTHRRVAYRIRGEVEPGIGDLAWQPRLPRRR